MDQKVYEMHAEICKIFTSPKRLEIIDNLREGERSVSQLSESLKTSQSNVSQHLAILREKGVIAPRKEGSTTYYRIANPKILDACRLMREVLFERLEKDRKIAESAAKR
ncbi:putative HTH-type transcriptional regulator/MT0088 [archaeon BMS3Abin16]|nr:putative HTH-type transcriptional regulator/MT0088 [archaeon BMS3Abin16]HDY74583.1 transcriptional regulator [Euryarchaeota archaeon]